MSIVPIVGLVGGLSCLGHKVSRSPEVDDAAGLIQGGRQEWRFIVYTVPLFNILAATGAARMYAFGHSTALR